MKIPHTPDPIALRVRKYPRVEDQLDALWKSALFDSLPADDPAVVMRDRVRAVKATYPKGR